MALEAVVFPKHIFGCTMKELHNMVVSVRGYNLCEDEKNVVALECEKTSSGHGFNSLDQDNALIDRLHGHWDSACSNMVQNIDDWVVSSPEVPALAKDGALVVNREVVTTGRRKRRRTKSLKNKEEVENQRMIHIAVERNRRKQMNEYLAVLRSLMPTSYVHRGDQASIIGGAINFVKELEQLVQSLEAQKKIKQRSDAVPFADFFAFPQYSSTSSQNTNTARNTNSDEVMAAGEKRSDVADIEVHMVETHANLKVLTQQRPKQLLKMVVGLQSLRLMTLHLNVTTIDEMVLYSFSLKVEDECQLASVDEIATAVHRIVSNIQEEAAFN